jgi:hypothetical protein
MKDTQQHLLIEDLDYCNTACDEAEEIVGGGLWKAIKDTTKAKWNAIVATGEGILQGTLPSGKTAADLVTPMSIGILERLTKNYN